VQILGTKFEFGGSFGMSLEGDCREAEVIPSSELLVIFGMSLEEVVENHNTLKPQFFSIKC
jgi:hypothetical protein